MSFPTARYKNGTLLHHQRNPRLFRRKRYEAAVNHSQTSSDLMLELLVLWKRVGLKDLGWFVCRIFKVFLSVEIRILIAPVKSSSYTLFITNLLPDDNDIFAGRSDCSKLGNSWGFMFRVIMSSTKKLLKYLELFGVWDIAMSLKILLLFTQKRCDKWVILLSISRFCLFKNKLSDFAVGVHVNDVVIFYVQDGNRKKCGSYFFYWVCERCYLNC